MAEVSAKKTVGNGNTKAGNKIVSGYGISSDDLKLLLANGYTRDDVKAMTQGQKMALVLVYKRRAASESQKAAKEELERMREAKKAAERQKREAERKLKKLQDAEKVIVALAGIPTPEEDRANRVKAIDCFFDLLNMVPYHEQDDEGNSHKVSFAGLYNCVHPVTYLFDYVRKATHFDINSKCICIDAVELYKLIMARLNEQEQMKQEARVSFEDMNRYVMDLDTGNSEHDVPDETAVPETEDGPVTETVETESELSAEETEAVEEEKPE